jgi:hypothetical protein
MGIEILHAASNKTFFEHEDTKAQSRYREANIAVGKYRRRQISRSKYHEVAIAVGNYHEVTIAKSISPPKTL